MCIFMWFYCLVVSNYYFLSCTTVEKINAKMPYTYLHKIINFIIIIVYSAVQMLQLCMNIVYIFSFP